MNITVYLGANMGGSPKYEKAVKELGTWIGESGNNLVYGGSHSGLMGVLADAALDAGAFVTGVEPQFFLDAGLLHEGIQKLYVTKDMADRKTRMIELGDAFIAFPGGTGTLEEICEVMEKVTLASFPGGEAAGIVKPCILYNLDGYYEHLKALLDQMLKEGFTTKERLAGIKFADTIDDICRILGTKNER